MRDKPPFDPQRAAFWLVACVLGYQGIIVLFGVGTCFFDFIHNVEKMISGSRARCDPDNRLLDLLTSALSAALGFAAGMMRGGPPPPPSTKEPP
jgi:hypothetical protein